MTDAQDAVESSTEVFKIPNLLPKKIPPKLKTETSQDEIESAEKEVTPKTEDIPVPQPVKSSKLTISTHPLPYTEPSWGGQPDTFYSLEEMKGGISLRNIPLDSRSFHTFGRLDNCHIVMAHPTISRYHAILQFRSTFSSDDEKKGFYLYDLGSTHGTFLNKMRIKPKVYVKILVGHMIKFGSSTRSFLLHGPEEDQEDESQYTYTQLKEMRKQELEKRQADYLEERAKLLKKEEEEESKGIDWGMGEDADEETDLTENPFALTTNEDLYKDDPKKYLKQWFDREGEELKYHIEEKGFGQFRCTIELPLENAGGGATLAEASVSGKKKEAAFQCALEACRILDKAGLLRQSNQETRKRKLKNWEEDDYYDSDEDNFFDRTGELEAKRKSRMKQGQKTQPTTETYETLCEKHKKILQEIEEMERKLNAMLLEARRNNDDENDESLESFTSHKRSGQILDKLEFKKIKVSLNSLKNDEEKLRKLINFVKPFELPELKPLDSKPIEEIVPPSNDRKREFKKTNDDLRSGKKYKAEENEIPTEIPSSSSAEKKIEEKQVPEKTDTEVANVKKKEKNVPKNVQNPVLPDNMRKMLSKTQNSDKAKKIAQSYSNHYEEDFNNIVWTPPTGQSGDGRTSLNDKYGY